MATEDTAPAPEAESPAPEAQAPNTEVEGLKSALETEKAAKAQLAEEVKLTKDFAAKLIDRMKSIAAQEPAPSNDPDEFLEEFRQDPKGALDRHIQERMAPIFEEQLRGQEEIAVEAAKGMVGEKNWNRYSKEVVEFMGPISQVLRSKPQAWLNAFKQVRANHFDEEVERAMKEKLESEKQSALESASPPSAGKRGKAPITPIEKQIAEGLLGKFDETEWRRWRGEDSEVKE